MVLSAAAASVAYRFSHAGTHQGIRPSSCLLTAFLAPPLISKTIMTESRRPSLTLADPWVAIFSSLVVLACLTATLDEPELKSWFVKEVIRPQPRSLSWIFILLLNNSVYGSSLLKAAPRISILFGNQLFVRKVVELRWVAKWTTQR